MITLNRLHLWHWNRWDNVTLEFTDGATMVIGPNASGKSSLLDALQVLMTADRRSVKFNTSREGKSPRNMDTYVRGKIKDNYFLRPGDTVGLLAAELHNHTLGTYTTIGVCLEAAAGRGTPDQLRFIIPAELDPDLFVRPTGDGVEPVPRAVLRERLLHVQGAAVFDTVPQYQAALLQALGQLNERFSHTFNRAMAHSSMRTTTVEDFVNEMVLAEHRIDPSGLRDAQTSATKMSRAIDDTLRQIDALREILEIQGNIRQVEELIQRQDITIALLEERIAEHWLEHYRATISELEPRLAALKRREEELLMEIPALEATREDVREKLHSSDIAAKATHLQDTINRLKREIQEIRKHRGRVEQDTRRFLPQVKHLLADHDSVRALPGALDTLAQDHHADDLVTHLNTIATTLNQQRDRLVEDRGLKRAALTELNAAIDKTAKDLTHLEGGGRQAAPEAVEAFRAELAKRLKLDVPLLYEVLSIPQEQHQDIIEAVLGHARFAAIVPPAHLPEAQQLLAGWPRNAPTALFLADTAAAAPASLAGTLAEHITSDHDTALKYAHALLGQFSSVTTLDDARELGAGTTEDLLIYEHATALNPLSGHHPWQIGERGRHQRIQTLRATLTDMRDRGERLREDLEDIEEQIGLRHIINDLRQVAQDAERDINEADPIIELRQAAAALAELDRSEIDAWQAKDHELTTSIAKLQVEQLQAATKIGTLTSDLETARANEQQAQATWNTKHHASQDLKGAATTPDQVAVAQRNAAGYSDNPAALTKAIEDITENQSGRRTNRLNLTTQFTQYTNDFAHEYHFDGDCVDVHTPLYQQHLEHLNDDDLTEYHRKLEEYTQQIDDILQSHILFELYSRFGEARQEVDRINEALKTVTFGGSTFQFRMHPNRQHKTEYDLVKRLGFAPRDGAPLLNEDLYREHEADLKHLTQTLVRTPRTDGEREQQDELLDYRAYFTFDIEETDQYGRTSSVSKSIASGSGGEDQIAFYVTIAAAMAQLYHTTDPRLQNTFRALVLDEMGSKLDGDRAANLVTFYQQLGLQTILVQPNDQKQILKDVVGRIYVVWNDREGYAHVKEVDNLDQIDSFPQTQAA